MNQQEYTNALEAELNKNSESVTDNWNKVLSILPTETVEVHVIISPNQDGDGIFSVFISLIGPDLYVLNKKIRNHYRLFSPVYTANGLEPHIPGVDPFDVDFEVNDTIVDVAMEWLERLWSNLENKEISVPVGIYGDDGYGTKSSKHLK